MHRQRRPHGHYPRSGSLAGPRPADVHRSICRHRSWPQPAECWRAGVTPRHRPTSPPAAVGRPDYALLIQERSGPSPERRRQAGGDPQGVPPTDRRPCRGGPAVCHPDAGVRGGAPWPGRPRAALKPTQWRHVDLLHLEPPAPNPWPGSSTSRGEGFRTECTGFGINLDHRHLRVRLPHRDPRRDLVGSNGATSSRGKLGGDASPPPLLTRHRRPRPRAGRRPPAGATRVCSPTSRALRRLAELDDTSRVACPADPPPGASDGREVAHRQRQRRRQGPPRVDRRLLHRRPTRHPHDRRRRDQMGPPRSRRRAIKPG